MTESLDYLYGGLFDIALGERTAIDKARIHAAAIFYDAIVVPDGFFTAKGPLFRHLQRLAADQASEDDLLLYLRRGVVAPALRKGDHISDIWFNGEDVGFTRGHYLSARRDEGDKVFEYLRRHPMAHRPWPQQMAEASVADFGTMLHDAFSTEFFAELSKLEAAFDTTTLRGFTAADATQARHLVGKFEEFIERNCSRTKFRRGEIESFIATTLGWSESFSYDRLIKCRSVDLPHAASNAIMEAVSTIYEIYQAQQFRCHTQLYPLNDPAASAPYVGKGVWQYHTLNSATVDLLPSVDFSKLRSQDILDLRALPDKNGDQLFGKAKRLRATASTGSPEAIAELLDFCEAEYMPRLLQIAPHASRETVARPARRVLEFTGDASTTTGIVCLALGAVGFAIAGPIEAIATIVGAASFSIVGRRLQKPTFLDRMLQSRQKERALERLSREMSMFDSADH